MANANVRMQSCGGQVWWTRGLVIMKLIMCFGVNHTVITHVWAKFQQYYIPVTAEGRQLRAMTVFWTSRHDDTVLDCHTTSFSLSKCFCVRVCQPSFNESVIVVCNREWNTVPQVVPDREHTSTVLSNWSHTRI